MQKGKFIVFEGADGSGKTTQAKLLHEYLLKLCGKRECIFTAEPTSGHFGKLCREIGAGRIKAAADTQALLYAADRIEHIKTLIPELEKGSHVICDRYYISSLAYQSVETDFENVLAYNKVPMKLLKPDLIIYTDVSLEICEKRRLKRAGKADIYEFSDYAKKVHEQYHYTIERLKDTENIRVINGAMGKNQVFKLVTNIFNEEFKSEEFN